MKRAARHGVYIDEPNIIDAQFDAGVCKDEFYIKVHKKVAASYHNKTNKIFYDTTTIFTATKFTGNALLLSVRS